MTEVDMGAQICSLDKIYCSINTSSNPPLAVDGHANGLLMSYVEKKQNRQNM